MANMTFRVAEMPGRSATIVSVCGLDLTFASTREALQWIADVAREHKLKLTRFAEGEAQVEVTQTVVPTR